ncbi:MAG: hypothetical protein KKE53_08105 [Proteobacteria bacterium]|nr:hypothetical protein [Pseudomonadota bacterium]
MKNCISKTNTLMLLFIIITRLTQAAECFGVDITGTDPASPALSVIGEMGLGVVKI